jgi:N-acetylglucosaminyldiphosphoundecaprenol N-acetyl-beta-D-mannosaminyltransferase
MNQRIKLFGFELDAIGMFEAVEQIYVWVARGQKDCRFVVTPNVDHAVLYQRHAGLRQAYANASLVLADGMPVVAAARLLGRRLPGRVPGSDLAPELFAAAARHGALRVYLLGAGPGVAERAAVNIAARWPAVHVVGTYSPPLGFERDRNENDKILAQIAAAKPDVLLVGLGAPKQELWVNAHRHRIEAAATLCIGATIDFLAGEKKRAPRWMRRAGLEWLHRVASEPRRLLGRYARDACIFPSLVAREWIATLRPAPHGGLPNG